MKKLNQSGFSAVEAILILVVLGIVSFTGWFVYYSKQTTDKTFLQTNTSSAPKTIKKSMAVTTATINAVKVAEWSIKIEFADADKVTYKISTNDNGTQGLELLLKPSATSISGCQDLGVGYQRDPGARDEGVDAINKIVVGGHVYAPGGGPGACDEGKGATSGPINSLRAKIDSEISAAKIETL